MVVVIDSSAIADHAARLAKMSRSALPVVTRQTLNRAAYDVKKRTMPREADKTFVKRKKTFFKANSRVEQAQGFDINTMEAKVGFLPKVADKSHSVEDLQEQEEGGDIKGRAFIALPKARTSNSWGKNVRVKNRLENMRNSIFDSKNGNLKVKGKEGYVISALYAGVGGFVLNQSHTHVSEITGIKRVGRNTKITQKTVYSVKKGRAAHVHATHFMRTASLDSAREMEKWFKELAEKKLNG
jgi:hypothetical protein